MKEAWFYDKLNNHRVHCRLCPHNCKIGEGKLGICAVRQNIEGKLYSLVYERAIAVHVDPIEKKPLFHVYPGSQSLSMATAGCNFSCRFCQNHDISQMPRSGRIMGDTIDARSIADTAFRHECKTISCTYTEPTIYFEYAYDISVQARENGMDTVWVSNGYINEEPLRKAAPYLLAANVDLKGWHEDFYRKMVGGDLKSVLKTLRLMKELGIWLEVTTLVVPGAVDDEDSLKEIATFVVNELGAETPWHISRFYPQYQCTHMPPTPISVLRRAREIGLQAGLRYVYSGNVPGDEGEHTYCHSCGELLIERYGFQIIANRIKDGRCPKCSTRVDGIGIG